jgi:hypothetical protein
MGTRFWDRRLKGAYMDLLCYQADKYSSGKDYKMTEEEIKIILQNDSDLWEIIQDKYEKKNGKFWNKKLLKVQTDRKNFTLSRKLNKLGKTYDEDVRNICNSYLRFMTVHMEDGNENEIVNINKIENIINTLKKKENFEVAWAKWYDFRKEIKKRLTPTSVISQLKKLSEFTDPVASIENSITNGYMGLFEVKNGRTKPVITESELRNFSESILNDDRYK